jgi:uncharacterized protein YjbJ (UPF0337 family)
MNQDQAQGKWNQVKGTAKQVWGKLADDDRKRNEGSADKVHGIIQEKFGDAKQAIKGKPDTLGLK